MDPKPNKADTSPITEEEMFRNMEKEIEEDIKQRRKEKVKQLQIAACLPVCQCGDNCPHKPTSKVRRVWDKVNLVKAEGQPIGIKSQNFVKPDTYQDGFMAPLTQKGTCPYVKMQLLGQTFEALLDSGSGLSLMSRQAARRIMKSDIWKEAKKKGQVQYRTDLKVEAVNCNGEPITIVGRMILPTISINGVNLNTPCSFWIMKSSVDELLISNQWMMPLQGAIAWREGGQFLYFKLPTDVTQQLKAGGEELAKVQKEKNQELTIENDIEEEESNTSGSDEELEVGVEKNGGINNEGVIQSAEVGNKGVGDTIDIVTSSAQGRHTGVNSTRVSTQNSKDIKGVGIERKKQTVIVFNSKEAAKVIQQFPNLKPKEKEMNMDWKSKTQPVLINSKIPGLLTQ